MNGWFLSDARLGALPFAATVSAESRIAKPAADVEIEFDDFAFNGLDAITAGPQLWKIANIGAQPDMLVLASVPSGTTQEELVAIVTEPEEGRLVEGAMNGSAFAVLSAGVLHFSPGRRMWLPLTLKVGDYAAICFVKDSRTGQSHSTEGMAQLFTLSHDEANQALRRARSFSLTSCHCSRRSLPSSLPLKEAAD